MWKTLQVLGLALCVMSAGACATGGAMEGGTDAAAAENAAVVTVDNNLAVPTSLTIYLYPENGVRRLLGTVSPGRRETLRVNANNLVGTARLVAMRPSGAELASQPLHISGGDQIVWDLQANIVRGQ